MDIQMILIVKSVNNIYFNINIDNILNRQLRQLKCINQHSMYINKYYIILLLVNIMLMIININLLIF